MIKLDKNRVIRTATEDDEAAKRKAKAASGGRTPKDEPTIKDEPGEVQTSGLGAGQGSGHIKR